MWQIADEAGFDHRWAFDHLAAIGASGEDRAVFEGWTLLAGMAVATKRTRIGLLVSGMAYRHPALLAKAAVTVDHLSGGRLEFGIGAGWAATEHQMFGIGQGGTQVDRFAEGLEVLKLLWSQERSNFSGRFFHLSDAVGNPKPVQQPHPPIWIGASGPKMLRIAAEHADVWNSAVPGLDAAAATGEQLLAACHAIGRDPKEIRWSGQVDCDGTNPEATVDELCHWWESGFSELVIYCRGADPVRSAEVAAENVLPQLRTTAARGGN
jgi:alkanesulfonate monooxygenase SsuD/methylene tetrahydromethanopterin reductase-like flavin-dependent oxidoreductase (luciferase family)